MPSRLEYRDLAIRTVASACKLVADGADDFHNDVISAFSEALNNVILHGYGPTIGELEIEIEPRQDRLTIRLRDYGKTFDPRLAPDPDLSLPESGMGVFIMRSFMDDISYAGGAPNTLSMTKLTRPKKRGS
jgi:serine/threonine-protein kinase RsbW